MYDIHAPDVWPPITTVGRCRWQNVFLDINSTRYCEHTSFATVQARFLKLYMFDEHEDQI